MNRHFFASVACLAVMFCIVGRAPADTITYDLTTLNTSGFVGPYVQVDVTTPGANSSTATITFTSLSNASNYYLMGSQGAAGVNVNGAATLGSISDSNSFSGFTPGPASDGGSGNEDGYGNFNVTIDSFDSWTHSNTTISFILTKSSGSWASAADVLTPNENGEIAAAHVLIGDATPAPGDGAIATQYASGAVVVVPLPPASWAGMGLMLACGCARAIRGRRAAAI